MLCGVGCAALLVTSLFWTAWMIYPPGRPHHLLSNLYLLAGIAAPLVAAAGTALLIVASLHKSQSSGEQSSRNPGTSWQQATVWGGVVVAAGVAVVVVAATSVSTLRDDGYPRLMRGTVTEVSSDGVSFVFDPDGRGEDQRHALNTKVWIDTRGARRNDARPACLRPGSDTRRKVELAFLDVKGGQEYGFGDYPYLLSVRCLD